MWRYYYIDFCSGHEPVPGRAARPTRFTLASDAFGGMVSVAVSGI
jgi:hypothetical protein